MATVYDGETKECTFEWKIENISQCWWMERGKYIESPTFIVDVLMGTKWSLSLYPIAGDFEKYFGLYLNREEDCSGPNVIEVNFQLAFLGKHGSLLTVYSDYASFEKKGSRGSNQFERRARVFDHEKEAFICEDALTVQCALDKIQHKPVVVTKSLYGRTVLKVDRKSFAWRMDKFSAIHPGLRKKFKDRLFEFDLVFNEDVVKTLDIDVISLDASIKYISFDTSIVNSEGRKETCGIKKYFTNDLIKGVLSPLLVFRHKWTENKSLFLPNDVLSLDLDVAFSTIESYGCGKNSTKLEDDIVSESCVKKENTQNTAVLIEDLKSMYKDGIFNDTEIRTTTRNFPAHKSILSARSPVFNRMFTNYMKEKNSGHVDITDFEDDSVERMLLFLYTGNLDLDNMQLESVSKLYAAADKYQIVSLKSKCSNFLIDNLCPSNACDVLLLADLHQDDLLKSSVQIYILENQEVFKSQEFKIFMDSNLKLAADIMYRKVNPDKTYPCSK